VLDALHAAYADDPLRTDDRIPPSTDGRFQTSPDFPVVPGMSSADLESLASAALANARSHGIVSEEDSFRFLDFALRYGPKFGEKDCTPWAHEILSTAHLGPDEKLNLLEGYELYGEGRVKT
jgi:hypothetical protein